MNNSLSRNLGLLIFRVGISFWMISNHGWGKFSTLINGDEIQFLDPIGIGMTISFILAMFAEFFCSILVALGVWVRWAAVPLLFTMLIAFFIAHGADPIAKREIAGLYLVGYAMIVFTGGGRFALGTLLGGKYR